MTVLSPQSECVPSSATEHFPFDLARILAARSLRSQYQPIFSVLSQRLVGLEALARAVDPETKEPIPPLALFEAAQRRGLTLGLDRLCREKAVEGFVAIDAAEPLLFLNLDVSILQDGVVGSGHLSCVLEKFGLPAQRVVIELVESKIGDMRAMHRFLDAHRAQGYLLALDDVGSGSSNLDRILEVRPDILKLDRSLIAGIDREYRKQEMLSCCLHIAHKLGTVVVAEGIETEAEALCCLERGVDLMQGFYFARPCYPGPNWQVAEGVRKAHELGASLRQRERERFAARKERYRKFTTIADRICGVPQASSPEAWTDAIRTELTNHPFVECAYILDQAGIQLTDTIFAPGRQGNRCNLLFAPAAKGADQGSKEYFIRLGSQQARYVTDPYISRATGTLCVTLSTMVPLPDGRVVVACVDVDASDIPT